MNAELQSSATPFADAARAAPELPSNALLKSGVRGESGPPLVGHSLSFLFNTQPMMDRLLERYGPDFRVQIFGVPFFVVGSPDAVREAFLDRDKNFSSRLGWTVAIGKLFARGLMLLDFEEHRLDRRIMQTAFRTEAMRGYVDMMNPLIRAAGASVPQKFLFYPWIKQLTLDMASRIFLGLTLGADSERINRAFSDAVAASVALVKREVPGLSFARGMRGRRVLESYFRGLVKDRRGKPGNDLFSELCRAQSDQGERFSDESIVDHMIFLMMAAHDTTTSTLGSMVHCLIEHPEWQERIRAELHARGELPLTWDQRDALPTLDRVFDETLRLFPPAPFITRRNLRPWKVGDVTVPANTALMISSLVTHRLPQYWKDPARFDPDRFLPERSEHTAHSHVYYPFGSGAHICMGMHFARFQVKAVLNELLFHHRIRSDGPMPKHRFASVPIPRPRDGLPVLLERI